jgi:alkylation response protein AidB-like acyl-CoA dehydrogenase
LTAASCSSADAIVADQDAVATVQLFGGARYTTDFPVERMMRDPKITQTTRAPTRFSAS